MKLLTDINNLSGITNIHNTSAQLYISSGEYQEALNEYDKVLAIEPKIDDPRLPAITLTYPHLRAITLTYIANVYSTLGEYQKSIDNLTQAKKIFDKIGDRAQVARTYQNIGNIYLYQSLKDDNPLPQELCKSAEDCYTKALNLSHELGDTWLELSMLQSIVKVNVTSNKYEEAEEAEKSARQIFSLSKAQGYSMFQAIAYNEIARVYQASRNYQKALDYSDQALKLYQKLQLRDGEAGTLGNIGKTYKSLRQYKQAIDAHNKELALWDKLSDKINQAEAHYNIAVNQSMVGNDSQALRGMEQTIAITEGIRSKVDSQELRTSYFATVQKYYEFYIDLLMQLHKKDPTKVCEFKTKDLNIKDRCDAVALHMSERARARSLVELLTEANANIREGIKPELLKRERDLQQRLDALEKQILKLDNEDIKQQINKFRDDYQQLRTEIRRQSPRYAALKFPEPLTLKEIQQKVLDDDTLLLIYSLGEERSYLWLVSKTEIHSYELPKRADIKENARQFYEYLKKNNQTNSQAATELSKMLLQPVANKLGKKRLLIVSDGALQYVPFTALPSPEHTSQREKPIYLLENHEIINSPSASTIAILRSEQQNRKPAPKTLAVLADPVFTKNDTRFTGNSSDESPKQYCSVKKIAKRETLVETLHVTSLHSLTEQYSSPKNMKILQRVKNTLNLATEILKLVQPSECIEAFGFDANRAFATNPELSQYRYVMFATHGDINSTNPELSSLVLSLLNEKGEPENGYLRLNDIFNLNLPAELVVLSACDTGLGKVIRGEGLVGLTRGFMYAGSPRLVVSLWKIADDGTAVLMEKFFTKMLKEGLKPAEALRAAQREMLQDEKYEKYSAPYYWAAFTLQGEWR